MVEQTLDDRFDYSVLPPEKAEIMKGIAARLRSLLMGVKNERLAKKANIRRERKLLENHLREQKRKRRKDVYFFASGGLIKIGMANDVAERQRDIQALCATPVVCIGIIQGVGISMEKQLHRRFHHIHAHHEWFQDTPELRAHISSIATTQGIEVSL